MNAVQTQRNELSQRIEKAVEGNYPSSAQMREISNVASILWRASGESEWGFQPEELTGLPQRIRGVAQVLDISVTDEEIAGCDLPA
jgi:hypothetical protein